MSRWHTVFVLASGLTIFSGCQSGPWGFSEAEPAASQAAPFEGDLDPRITSLEDKNTLSSKLLGRGSRNGVSKEYSEAKKVLSNAENLMLTNANWLESVGKPTPLEQARQIYTNILNDNPGSVKAMLGLARVDHKSDRLEDAERMFRTVLHKYPNNTEALAATASFYNETDRADESLRLLASAVKTNPEDRDLRQQMGIALVKAGQPEAAIPHFTKCVGTASALYNVGYVLKEQGQYAQAERYLQRAVDRNPELKAAHAVLAELPTRSNIQHAHSNDRAAAPVIQAQGFGGR